MAAAIDLDSEVTAAEASAPEATGSKLSLLAAVRARSVRLGPECVRRALLARLTPRKEDRLLELGVGSGSTLLAVATRASEGFVAGIEPDPLALRHARRRCERLVRDGRVTLAAGSSSDLSMFEPASFDKVYGVHVSSFWDEPAGHLAEIRRVLRPGGLLLLGRSPWLPEGLATGERLEHALRETGFRSVHTDCADPMVWTTAR
ncbi:MAG: class I SAM-dependent methyltransferase [Myxococcota bacterium]